MIHCVGRSKTGTDRAIGNEKPDIISQKGITARAQTHKIFLNKGTADIITQGYIDQEKQNPYPSFYFKIKGNKYYQEKVQRNPNGWLADKGKENIKKRIMPLAIHFCKQVIIKLFYRIGEKGSIFYLYENHYCKNNHCPKTVVKYLHLLHSL